jgi:hypothetical protein
MSAPVVVSVAPGSAAERAGLCAGDEVVTINGIVPRDVIEWRFLVEDDDLAPAKKPEHISPPALPGGVIEDRHAPGATGLERSHVPGRAPNFVPLGLHPTKGRSSEDVLLDGDELPATAPADRNRDAGGDNATTNPGTGET